MPPITQKPPITQNKVQEHGGNYDALSLLWRNQELQVELEGLMKHIDGSDSEFGTMVPWDKAYKSYCQKSDDEGQVGAILTFVKFAEQVVDDPDIAWKNTEPKELRDEKWETFKIAANLRFEIKRENLVMKKKLQKQIDDVSCCRAPEA